ncbi:MAG: LTA synthase family protein [Succinivibrionaceae bacterium]|nr:LTA synthase family protein [Succinivibrionaceae bacterium]
MKLFVTLSKIIVVLIILIICSALFYLFSVFPHAKIEEIIFQLQAPTGKLTFEQLLPVFLYFCGPFCVLTVSFLIILKILKSFKNAFALLVASCLSFIAFAFFKLNIYQYIVDTVQNSNFIETNYVNPKEVNLKFPEKKRNLIYIILESMELTFSDKNNGGYFDKNRIPELSSIASQWETFNGDFKILNGSVPVYGTTWTMGAVFGLTSGLPLKISVGVNSMTTQKHFFKNVTTLSDILYENGYDNVVMKDLDMTFAGAELFFKEHGKSTVMDYKYCSEHGFIPKDYYVWWGFEDEKLFNIARDQITQKAQQDKPFSFIIFTNDTHMEDGYLSDFCPQIFDDKYSNVINCSSMQVSKFLSWIQKQPFYNNTTVVIVGDHLTMDSDYAKDISNDYKRKVYTTIINSPMHPITSSFRKYSTFDLFPTVLSSLGVDIEGEKLGLGVNLYSNEPTLLEKIGENEFNVNLSKKSQFMENLAQISSSRILENEDSIIDYVMDLNEEEYQSYIDMYNSTNSFVDFLNSLKSLLKHERYVVLFSARNGLGTDNKLYSKFLNDIYQAMHGLNLEVDFKKHLDASYVALLYKDQIFEKYDDSKSIQIKKILTDHNFNLISAGRGNYAYINIDGMDYSMNGYGINFVVYDLKSNVVTASGYIPNYRRIVQ